MGELLKYRIPGQEPVEKIGEFQKINSFKGYNGFVLSSFDKHERYGFTEIEGDFKFRHGSKTPVCYSKEAYMDKGLRFIDSFSISGVQKAILSRVSQVHYAKNPIKLYDALCESYPNAFVYIVSSRLFGTWIGATPEVLLTQKSGKGSTIALAGTKKTDDNTDWTEKERVEQKYVSSFIEENLKELNIENISTHGPNTVNFGPVEHLKTDFSFDLDQSSQLELIEALHPTPAVCGFPREGAYKLIRDVETHDRSLYAGIIGLLGEHTRLFVNLRCAQLFDTECYLYLGGGYTKDSDPEKEWEETENKGKTLLNIIEKI